MRDVELVARIESEPVVRAVPGHVASSLVELVLDGLDGAARDDTVELVVADRDGYATASVGASELRLPVAQQ